MWENWVKAGVMLLEDLFDGKHLIFNFFEQCMSKYNIPSKDFWKFLQLRSCIITADRKVKFVPVWSGIQIV